MKASADYLNLPRKSTDKILHLPGDNGKMPVLGDTVEFLTDYLGLVSRKHKLYGHKDLGGNV